MNHRFCLGIWNPETGWSREDSTPRQWAQQQAPPPPWGGEGMVLQDPLPLQVFLSHDSPGALSPKSVLLSALLNSVSITVDFVDLPKNRPVFAGPCLDKLPHSSLCPTHPVQWSHKSQQQATAVSIISATKGGPLPTL